MLCICRKYYDISMYLVCEQGGGSTKIGARCESGSLQYKLSTHILSSDVMSTPSFALTFFLYFLLLMFLSSLIQATAI